MNLFNIFKLAFFNLKSNKVRTGLTILGMVVGISAIVVLYSLGNGLNLSVEEKLNKWGSDTLFVLPGKTMLDRLYVKLDSDDVDFLKSLKGVEKAFPLYMTSLLLKKNKHSTSVLVFGIDPVFLSTFSEMGFFSLKEGRFFSRSEKNSVLVGQNLSFNFSNTPLKIKESVFLDGKKFKICGLFGSGQNAMSSSLKNAVIISEDSIKTLVPSIKISRIFVKVAEGSSLTETAELIKNKLKRKHGVEDFTVYTPEKIMQIASNVLNIVQGFLLVIALVSLFIGSLGIANSVYMSVYERTSFLGIMKAIGATKKDILLMIVFEAGLLGLFSGIIGLVLGFILSYLFSLIIIQMGFSFVFSFSFEIFLLASVLSFIIGILAGLSAAKKAAELDIVEAIYSY